MTRQIEHLNELGPTCYHIQCDVCNVLFLFPSQCQPLEQKNTLFGGPKKAGLIELNGAALQKRPFLKNTKV